MSRVIYLILFIVSSFCVFAESNSLSIFIGPKGETKVPCSTLDNSYFLCEHEQRQLYVRRDEVFSESALVAVDVSGDEIQYFNIEKYEFNGELKKIPSTLFFPSNLDGYVFKDRPVATAGVNERILLAESMLAWIKGLDGVVPENLKSLHQKLRSDVDQTNQKIMESDATVEIDGEEYFCPASEQRDKRCQVSSCTKNRPGKKEKTYLIKERSEWGNFNFYQFSVNKRGELTGVDSVLDIIFDGFSTPHYPPSNYFGFDPNSPVSLYPDANMSIVTENMRVPPEFKNNPALFHQLTDPYVIENVNKSLKFCPTRIKNLFQKSLDKARERLEVSTMVQLIEKTNWGLSSDFVNQDLLPEGICQRGNYFYEEEAESEIEQYAPSGEVTPITMDQARQLFEEQKKRTDIAWNYQDDGCYARAHLMTRAFDKEGITSDKIWARGDFSIQARDGHEINWNYHVAPIVYVRGDNGDITKMVIDPSVSEGPLNVEQWLARFDKNTRQRKPAQLTTYPMPNDSISYSRTVFSFSNMIPMNPAMEADITEAERDNAARDVMKRYLDAKPGELFHY